MNGSYSYQEAFLGFASEMTHLRFEKAWTSLMSDSCFVEELTEITAADLRVALYQFSDYCWILLERKYRRTPGEDYDGTPFEKAEFYEICLRRTVLDFDLHLELNRGDLGAMLGMILRYNPSVTNHPGFVALMPLLTGFHTHKTRSNADNPGRIDSAILSRY